jgi:hypothetical protein
VRGRSDGAALLESRGAISEQPMDGGQQIHVALAMSKFFQKARTEEGYQLFDTINPR